MSEFWEYILLFSRYSQIHRDHGHGVSYHVYTSKLPIV